MAEDSILKQLITANTLKTGEVVFRGQDGWVSSIHGATLYDQDVNLDDEVTRFSAPHHVVGVYSIMVEVTGDTITPHHIREKIRATGPGNYDHYRHGDTSAMTLTALSPHRVDEETYHVSL